MKISPKKITAVIPCYNEEAGIAAVIKSFPLQQIEAHGYCLEILVIDNNSTDRTAEIARSLGARVVHEPKKGKGNAIRSGFFHISEDTDYVVMLDGDDTYRPEEVLRLIELLDSGFCNVVIGSRLGGRISKGSMSAFNRGGNWIFSHLVRYIFRVNVTDVLTGYFAWTRETVERLRPHLVSEGFAIEMEMITKMARLGEEIYSVPISYNARAGESNLRPIHDGVRILKMLLRNIYWKPKLQKLKRIAFVSDAVMPYHKGGKEKRLYEISKRLVSENCEVHIYTMKWWKGSNIIKHEGVYFHAICKLHPLYVNGRRSIWEAVAFAFATFKLLFAKFDVIDVDQMPYFQLFSARIVTWIRRKKLHVTWHEVCGKQGWTEYLGGVAGSIGNLTEQLALFVPDSIISNSEHTTKRLRQAGFKKEIKTVPLGVDLEGIYDAPPLAESDVIFVGRFLNHKNVDILIKAIAEIKKTLPHITCHIVGNGPEKSSLKKMIRELSLRDNVKILDTVREERDLYGLMKASKMLVLPSVREGFGLVVVEANAAGLPVITTSHKDNAAKDLIQEGVNGFLTELNAECLAEKIIQILQTRDTMEPKRGIEEYDWKEVVQNLKRSLALG